MNRKYNISVKYYHIEAYWSIHKGYKNVINRATKRFNRNETLFITAFRDPIERIISQYSFEWRWGCVGGKKKCNYTHKLLEEDHDKVTMDNYYRITNDTRSISDSAKYKFTNIPLSVIMDRVEKTEMKQNYYKGGAKSIYMNNYYLWLFCCNSTECSRNFYSNSNQKWKIKCFNHAKKLIKNQIDILLITEWFRS